ncbi:MAG: 8-oxo-dGTP diphosphatase MutT [Candidatus Rokuibacteriota bacterium]|nr:MAG: 8-oxo-dGTP diphosphatase MutT [Candidatus Rokubacteria bacterium]
MVHAAQPALRSVPDAILLRLLSLRGIVVTVPVVDVSAALIQDEAGRYLVTRRRRGSHLEGLWEFPGGKREAGESAEAALRRELSEELSATFAVGALVDTVRWEYPERVVVIAFYRCRLEAGTIAPRESQTMAWVAPERLTELEFPPADRELIARLEAGR